jgi:hypothetical protein
MSEANPRENWKLSMRGLVLAIVNFGKFFLKLLWKHKSKTIFSLYLFLSVVYYYITGGTFLHMSLLGRGNQVIIYITDYFMKHFAVLFDNPAAIITDIKMHVAFFDIELSKLMKSNIMKSNIMTSVSNAIPAQVQVILPEFTFASLAGLTFGSVSSLASFLYNEPVVSTIMLTAISYATLELTSFTIASVGVWGFWAWNNTGKRKRDHSVNDDDLKEVVINRSRLNKDTDIEANFNRVENLCTNFDFVYEKSSTMFYSKAAQFLGNSEKLNAEKLCNIIALLIKNDLIWFEPPRNLVEEGKFLISFQIRDSAGRNIPVLPGSLHVMKHGGGYDTWNANGLKMNESAKEAYIRLINSYGMNHLMKTNIFIRGQPVQNKSFIKPKNPDIGYSCPNIDPVEDPECAGQEDIINSEKIPDGCGVCSNTKCYSSTTLKDVAGRNMPDPTNPNYRYSDDDKVLFNRLSKKPGCI